MLNSRFNKLGRVRTQNTRVHDALCQLGRTEAHHFLFRSEVLIFRFTGAFVSQCSKTLTHKRNKFSCFFNSLSRRQSNMTHQESIRTAEEGDNLPD